MLNEAMIAMSPEDILKHQHDFLDYVEWLRSENKRLQVENSKYLANNGRQEETINKMVDELKNKDNDVANAVRAEHENMQHQIDELKCRLHQAETSSLGAESEPIEWLPTDGEEQPFIGELVWGVWRQTKHIYMHTYLGDDDVEWRNFEAWIRCPEYK